MSETPNLLLPYIAAAQAQKHVTHNEALRLIDGLVQISVRDRNLAAPPGSPAEGDRYIVAPGATGLWAGWDGDVAMWADGAWLRLPARQGWFAWVEDEARALVRGASGWLVFGDLTPAPSVDVAQGALGGATGVSVLEEALTGLSGASVDTSIVIPDRSICLGASVRVKTAITGATSFDAGIAGEPSKFGGTLPVTLGASNRGVIGPTAFYADTAVRLTANGGSFTGGAVTVAIHLLTVGAPD